MIGLHLSLSAPSASTNYHPCLIHYWSCYHDCQGKVDYLTLHEWRSLAQSSINYLPEFHSLSMMGL